MARVLLDPIGHELATAVGPGEAVRNRAAMAPLEAELARKKAVVRQGWGEKAAARVREKGKMTTWERIGALLDAGTELYEVGTLVNWGRKFEGPKGDAPGAGVVTGFGRIEDRWCVVIANDNTVASGAWWPLTPEKIERAQDMALSLRLPVVYLVDCSGLFLPEQSRSFSGRTGAGHIFQKNSALADSGVPQLAGVFGDCIAGGGYMPIISDRVYMTEGAYMVIAGAALIRGAKSQALTSLDIGGAEVHVHQSRCADERVPDDKTAIRCLREEVARLPGTAVGFYRHGAVPMPPKYEASELGSVFPPDSRQVYDIDEVIARLVDQSLFHEFLPGIGREMVTGVARISGLWVGIIANRQGIVAEPGHGKRPGGALYREGIAKIAAFSRACDDDGLPLVWLQDIAGFDIGVQAERLGLLGYGSSLIYGNSTHRAPVFTVLLRKASGAGYYAMGGHPYQPVIQLSTPITRLAVMEGRTLAIATYNSKLDDDFEIATQDPAERAAIESGMTEVAARIDGDMDPVASASRMDTDEIVPVGELRSWLEMLVESAWQSAGYRRTKNPRIWSLHDLEVLGKPATAADPSRAAILEGSELGAPTVGYWRPEAAVGAEVEGGQVVGVLARGGRLVRITAPDGVQGVAVQVMAPGWVEFGGALVSIGERSGVSSRAPRAAAAAAGGAPADVQVVVADTDGTIYLRPDPASPAFAAEGSLVTAHQTMALVEVMKTFSPVRAPRDGAVARCLVRDGQAVSAGDPLFWVR